MRRIVLEERRVNTREPYGITLFTIKDIESHFNETLSKVYKQVKLAEELSAKGFTEESEGILRSQIVLVESAYDYYLHELLRLGIVKIFTGEWKEKGEKYQKLELPLSFFEQAMKDNDKCDWLKEWITEKYSYLTLMDYSQLKNVCGLLCINVKDVAELAFYSVGSQEKSEYALERHIRETYSRRNKIAHQADRDMGTAKHQSISPSYVKCMIDIIRKVVLALSELARKKDNGEDSPLNVGKSIRRLQRELLNILRLRMNNLTTSL